MNSTVDVSAASIQTTSQMHCVRLAVFQHMSLVMGSYVWWTVWRGVAT